MKLKKLRKVVSISNRYRKTVDAKFLSAIRNSKIKVVEYFVIRLSQFILRIYEVYQILNNLKLLW